MRNMGLEALLALALAAPAAALAPSQQNTLRSLRLESARSAVAAVSTTDADAHGAAQKGFDGGGLPVTVRVLEPVDTIPLPGEGQEVPSSPAGTPAQPAPSAPSGTPRLGDSYRFEGRRSAMPNLTIYTPVKEAPGEDGSTTSPGGGSDWKSMAVKALPYVGIAATVGGLFFPPLLFLGGLLLGAWGAMKLLSRD